MEPENERVDATGAEDDDAEVSAYGEESAEISEVTESVPTQQEKAMAEVLRLEQTFKGGANWFFWIAGLSIINSVLILSGSNWSFIVGLGITQVADAIATSLKEDPGVSSMLVNGFVILFDLLAAGIFVFFGVLCRYRYLWAFWVGMFLYLCDGLIFLAVGGWLSLGFHVFVLFSIYGGLRAAKALKARETVPSPTPALGGTA